jgi:hypothetical protein
MRRREKRTFDDILAKVAPRNITQLQNRARTANRLAKSQIGKARASLYSVKHDALMAITCRFPDRVTISNDPQLGDLIVINFNEARFGLHIPLGEFVLRRKEQWVA